MTTLSIAIVVVAILVVLTFVWSMRSARNEPPAPRRRNDLQRRGRERDLP
jgi:heme/copper-type cytochrome/quinol oxidase subunit 2